MTVPRRVRAAADRVRARTRISSRVVAVSVVVGGVAAVVYTVWFLLAVTLGGTLVIVSPGLGMTVFQTMVLLPLLVAVYWAIWRLRNGGGAV